MKLRAVVVLGLHVREEVLDRLRRSVGIELDSDLAGAGIEVDLGIGGMGGGGDRQAEGGKHEQVTAEHRQLLCED